MPSSGEPYKFALTANLPRTFLGLSENAVTSLNHSDMVRGVRGGGNQEAGEIGLSLFVPHFSARLCDTGCLLIKPKKHPRTINQLKYCNHLDSPRALCSLIQRQCPDIYNIYMKYTEKYCKLIKFLKGVKFTQKYLFFCHIAFCVSYLLPYIRPPTPHPHIDSCRYNS